jgi:hypothetical protein
MDLINKINSSQRREVIDEDKRIHKRALDAEFAFVERIGEDSLPPNSDDRRIVFTVNKYISDIKNSLDGTYEETKDLKESGERYIVFSLGPTIPKWNELVLYLKTYNPTERLSNKDYEEIWANINEAILPSAYQVLNYYQVLSDELQADRAVARRGRRRDEDVLFQEFDALNKLISNIENRNFTKIESAISEEVKEKLTKSQPSKKAVPILAPYADRFAKAIQKIRETLSASYLDLINEDIADDVFEDAEAVILKQASDIFKDEFKIDVTEEQIRNIFREIEQENAGEDVALGIRNLFGDDVGWGKPKKGKGKTAVKNKKKMGDDELQINMEVVDKIKDGKHLNKMKKANKALALPFDDSNDSNYLK